MHAHFGPLLRVEARIALRRKGYGFFDINDIMAGYEDGLCPVAAAQAKVAIPDFGAATGDAVGAIGDGHIIQAILDFLKSPEGQAFIMALIKILISIFVAA